jgi:SAM-dependent methyltransferase
VSEFDSLVGAYAAFVEVWDRLDPGFGEWLDAVVTPADWAHTLVQPGGRALDLGCGPGRHLPLLAGRYAEVLAADPSPQMLAVASAVNRADSVGPAADSSKVWFVRGGLGERVGGRVGGESGAVLLTPAVHGRFDLVLSVHALHHAGPPEVVLPQLRELLAPGGTVVIADIVADPEDWLDADWHGARALEAADHARQLGGSDADAAVVERLLSHPDWLAMVARDTPLSAVRFRDAYAAAFPGAWINLEHLDPMFATCLWRAPGIPRPEAAETASRR